MVICCFVGNVKMFSSVWQVIRLDVDVHEWAGFFEVDAVAILGIRPSDGLPLMHASASLTTWLQCITTRAARRTRTSSARGWSGSSCALC